MTRDYLREFDERFGTENTKDGGGSNTGFAGCDDCFVNRQLRQEHRDFLQEALLASKQEGREEAVAYIEKHNESVGGSRFVIVNRKFLEAAKEEKV